MTRDSLVNVVRAHLTSRKLTVRDNAGMQLGGKLEDDAIGGVVDCLLDAQAVPELHICTEETERIPIETMAHLAAASVRS